MSRKRRRRGITPWKKSALRFCLLLLFAAGGLHLFRMFKVLEFEDQREAARWGSEITCAQASAFLPAENALKQEDVRELEYKINTTLAQDSIKLTNESPGARLWQDCYSGVGNMTLAAGKKTVDVEAVGTGGAFFTFHPMRLSAGSYYSSDSLMKDEILLDEETAWKLFGAFDVEGRTVQVQDLHLRIAGVYKKEEGKLYDKAGLAEYVVFVQYKTLLQCSGGSSEGGSSSPAQGLKSRLNRLFPVTATASEEADDSEDAKEESGAGAAGAGAETGTAGEAAETGSADNKTDGTSGGAAGDSSDETSGGSSKEKTQDMENVGTSNTAYKDTGKITIFEIVMPNPVEGYAAAALSSALGENSGAVVVDNTNRFGERHLLVDLRDFALLGMRTQPVRYPYWENAAMGWETIFAALFLLECVLILLTVLILVFMVIHWYRNKEWTLAGNIRNMQDSIYERQSRKRYPEYYREEEQEKPGDDRKKQEKQAEGKAPASDPEKGLLEDKGAVPFERIDRKAVQYETLHKDDQRSDGSSAHADTDSMRRGQQ